LKAFPGLGLNEHIEIDGPAVFAHACKMGLEGIVSKRKASTYRLRRTIVSPERKARSRLNSISTDAMAAAASVVLRSMG
jgi:hypothetical protein